MPSSIFPLHIDKFEFRIDGFTLKSKCYGYDSVESLKFLNQKITINLSTTETCSLALRMGDDKIHTIYATDALFSMNMKKAAEKKADLRAVFEYINQLTHERRVKRYQEQMEQGCVHYKFTDAAGKLRSARIHKNGDIILDNVVYNIRKARDSGTLKFGTAYGIGCDRTVDPYELSINEKKPLFRGWIEGSGSMRIDGGWDYPFIFNIIKSHL